eukprot:417566-Pyramimonas_sp.AAC.1
MGVTNAVKPSLRRRAPSTADNTVSRVTALLALLYTPTASRSRGRLGRGSGIGTGGMMKTGS